MRVAYKPTFLRQYKKLDPQLQLEVKEKIADFTDQKNHSRLKVHALKGKLKGAYSFSVNYKTRIVFSYESKDVAVLLAVGSHGVYNV